MLETFCDSLCYILCCDLGDKFYARIFEQTKWKFTLKTETKKRGRITKKSINKFIYHAERCVKLALIFILIKTRLLVKKFAFILD